MTCRTIQRMKHRSISFHRKWRMLSKLTVVDVDRLFSSTMSYISTLKTTVQMSKKRQKASSHYRLRSQRKTSIRCRLKSLNRCQLQFSINRHRLSLTTLYQTSLAKSYCRISTLLAISILIMNSEAESMQKQKSFYHLSISRKRTALTSKSKWRFQIVISTKNKISTTLFVSWLLFWKFVTWVLIDMKVQNMLYATYIWRKKKRQIDYVDTSPRNTLDKQLQSKYVYK